ncbi:hypothetical protein DWG18_06480 [Lysobacter sp. TY2-98]|uniref:hypothetical protein n=1 Tax=Lysobacter sp. TY2-98 TaxID=2290922 RepID=UPI000E20B709|nr:hypothetical protein [Lysobacter sp. TY2-98]AXK71964.1 hypothetical protein DWG18_06480 [Lysobacter sp. TY2-98]
MSKLSPLARTSLLAVVIVATASGCSWFHRGGNKLYAGPAESRPLEVPPDLDASATTPNATSATASGTQQAAAQSSALGFTVQGGKDDVYARVGTALGGITGLTIANRAPLIGAYDVDYSGSNFLVRVAAGENGTTYVSAVDPRGLPATGEAARRLIDALKTALAR